MKLCSFTSSSNKLFVDCLLLKAFFFYCLFSCSLAGLELTQITEDDRFLLQCLSPPPPCWDYRLVSPHPAKKKVLTYITIFQNTFISVNPYRFFLFLYPFWRTLLKKEIHTETWLPIYSSFLNQKEQNDSTVKQSRMTSDNADRNLRQRRGGMVHAPATESERTRKPRLPKAKQDLWQG